MGLELTDDLKSMCCIREKDKAQRLPVNGYYHNYVHIQTSKHLIVLSNAFMYRYITRI